MITMIIVGRTRISSDKTRAITITYKTFSAAASNFPCPFSIPFI